MTSCSAEWHSLLDLGGPQESEKNPNQLYIALIGVVPAHRTPGKLEAQNKYVLNEWIVEALINLVSKRSLQDFKGP